MSETLTFAKLEWLHLLWAILVIAAFLAWRVTRRSEVLDRLVAVSLRQTLVDAPSNASRLWRIALLTLAGTAMTLALARPQLGYEVVKTHRAGAAIMICLDVSRSMLAEDTAPNRLERAKAEVRDLLPLLEGDQVGLIAFAGRASVMSPLTPDFGFLRLALDDATPNSVTRGGTRLEEPIRKAVDGFAGTSGVSKSIILITDGEDHDSFVKEAAAYAAERGVRILAIGFGDEAGTQIRIRDQRTGVANMLTGTDGKPVISRLDGDLLRELALSTDGAYIPAGTGLLDLGTIYREHIAPLTRASLDSASQTIRNDVYQWAILAALFFLFAAVLVTLTSGRRHLDGVARSLMVGLAGLLLAAGEVAPAKAQASAQTSAQAGAQTDDQSNSQGQATGATDAQDNSDVASPTASPPTLPETARESYNAGVEALANQNFDEAERLMQHAVSIADTDETVRFQSMFNLGWVAVRRAEKLLSEKPEEALASLHGAADRWRRTLQLRPKDKATEKNLAAVVTRALALADQLATRSEQSLPELLQEAIEAQRQVLDSLRALAARQSTVEQLSRKELRQLNSAALNVADRVHQSIALNARQLREANNASPNQATQPPTSGAPSPPISSVALTRMATHLQGAQQNIVRSRGALRRKHSQHAFRAASVALKNLRSALEQTRELRERVELAIAEQSALHQLSASAVSAGIGATPDLPDWLDFDYLGESQRLLASGAGELSEVDADSPANDHLRTASAEMQSASFMLREGRVVEALPVQAQALTFLRRAHEHLLDLRGLIDLTVLSEEKLNDTLAQALPTQSVWDKLSTTHGDNVERMARLGHLLSEEAASARQQEAQRKVAPNGGSAKAGGATGSQPSRYSSKQLDQGYALWVQAKDALHDTQDLFEAKDSDERTEQTQAAMAIAVERLNALQQLFFNLLEHLRNVAEKQQGVNDDTNAAADADQEATAARALSIRQQGLQHRADGIAKALAQQAKQMSEQASGGGSAAAISGPANKAIVPEEHKKFADAAALVTEGTKAMGEAADLLSTLAGSDQWASAREPQGVALDKLMEALALLSPPQPQQQDQNQESQDGDDEQQHQQADNQEQQTEPQDRSESGLLQGVRDREAERREARRRQRSQYAPVDKDW